MNWEDAVAEAFEQLSPNIDSIYAEANRQSLKTWNSHHRRIAALSGFATGVILGLHLAGIALDAFHMMRRMGHASYGVGAILGERQELGNILEPEDLTLVLGLLADDPTIERSIGQGMAAELASRVGAQIGIRAIAKAMAKEHSELSGRRLSRKTAGRLGSRFAKRATRRVVWGVGAVLAAYDNQALIDDTLDAAIEFYTFKIDVGRRLS